MSTFAERLRSAMAAAGATAAEVARQAHVKPASVSDWLRGITQAEQIKAMPLLRAAAFLRVSPMRLLTGFGERQAGAPQVLAATEPANHYTASPFDALDMRAVYSLPRDDLLRLEGAWLAAARQLGLAVGKRRAA